MKRLLLLALPIFISVRLFGSDPAVPEVFTVWKALAEINPQTNKPTPEIRKIAAKPLRIGGFLIANEFEAGDLTAFLLSRYPSGCIHVPLPPPNNMIHVTMAPGKTSKPYFGKRVVVTGKLKVGDRLDSSYEMIADSVEELPY